MAQIAFNAANVAPAVPLTPLPDGWFPAIITESDIKPTSTGTGQRMPLTFTICEGHPYAKRKVFDGLNIVNDNPVAQQIAQEQLSAICHATGVINLQDTQQLHGIPLLIKLATTARREDTVTGKVYEPKNEIKGYAKIGTQTVNMTPPPAPGAAAGGAGASPAWATQAPPAQQAPVQQPVTQPAAQPAAFQAPPTGAQAWEQPATATAQPAQAEAQPAQQAQAPAVQATAPATQPAAAAPATDVPAWAQAGQA